jgi:hypothetical protein
MEILIGILVALVPLGFGLLIRAFGERRGWRARSMLVAAMLAMWLWYSLALAVNGRMGVFGFIVAAIVIGPFAIGGYFLAARVRRDVLNKYDERLAQRRRGSLRRRLLVDTPPNGQGSRGYLIANRRLSSPWGIDDAGFFRRSLTSSSRAASS